MRKELVELENRIITRMNGLCHLLISIEKTLLDQQVHTSWVTARQTLKTHQVNTIVLPTDSGLVLRIRKASAPEPARRELYQELGIDSQVIRPGKIWSGG